ncbi:MAG: (Fe-S)-binding protein [Nitrososphaerota archaeon]
MIFSGFVEKIEIKKISACTADSKRIKFIAQADKNLGDVLPILYLYIPNANYSEKLGCLTYTYRMHLITIFSNGKISMTYVKDNKEAEQLMNEVKNLINRAITYLKNYGKPDEKLLDLKKQTNPIQIYKILPKTNCKKCGEESCYAFSVKLFSGKKDLKDCPYVNISKLEKILQPIKI